MARATHSDDLLLEDLLEAIESGTLGLPNFQRDFDWTDEDIRSLLGTVLSGWPIGSLLLIEVTPMSSDFYQPRPFDEAPALATDVELVTLDGQQRLTALYQALAGLGRSVFAIRANKPIADIDDLDAAIVTIPRETWDAKYSSVASQWEKRYIPIKSLRTAADFYAWRDEAAAGDPAALEGLTALYRSMVSGLHAYRVPGVVVSRNTPPQAVARIFERVNRTGRTLGAFDLVVARSFTESFNLRKQWEAALEEYPSIRSFQKDDGLPILSAVALRLTEDVRQSAVLNLKAGAIRDSWGEGVKHYAAAIDFLAARLGVLRADWLPYKQLLTVLTALDFERPLVESSNLLEQWFWMTGFGQRYWAASNTRSVADYKSLLRGEAPIKNNLSLNRSELKQSTRQQDGARHKAFLCLLGTIASGGLDAAAGVGDAYDYSLFPRSHDADPPWHLRSMGFVIALPEWNDEKGAQAQLLPSDYGDLAPDALIELRMELLVHHLASATNIKCSLVEEDIASD